MASTLTISHIPRWVRIRITLNVLSISVRLLMTEKMMLNLISLGLLDVLGVTLTHLTHLT